MDNQRKKQAICVLRTVVLGALARTRNVHTRAPAHHSHSLRPACVHAFPRFAAIHTHAQGLDTVPPVSSQSHERFKADSRKSCGIVDSLHRVTTALGADEYAFLMSATYNRGGATLKALYVPLPIAQRFVPTRSRQADPATAMTRPSCADAQGETMNRSAVQETDDHRQAILQYVPQQCAAKLVSSRRSPQRNGRNSPVFGTVAISRGRG